MADVYDELGEMDDGPEASGSAEASGSTGGRVADVRGSADMRGPANMRGPADMRSPAHVRAAIALLGEWAHVDVVAAVGDCDVEQAAAAMAHLEQAGVIVGAAPATFASQALREEALSEIPASLRTVLHARSAVELRRRGAADAEVCAHLLNAPGAGVAVNVSILRRCAKEHLRAAHPQLAVACLRRALHEPPQEAQLPSLLLELADALLASGSASEALETARRACERADGLTSRAEAEVRAFRAQIALGQVERAIPRLVREIERVERRDPDLALRLELELLRESPIDARILEVGLRRYKQRTVEETLPSAASYLLTAGQLLAMGGESTAKQAVSTVRRGLALIGEDERDEAETVIRSLWLLIRADEKDYAYTVLKEARSSLPSRSTQPSIDAMHGAMSLRWGSVRSATRQLTDALTLARRHGDALATWAAIAFLGHALYESDENGALQRLLADNDPSRHPGNAFGAMLRVVRARCLLSAGRAKEALADLLAVEERKVALGLTNPAGFHHIEPAVDCLLLLGETQRAREMAELNLGRAESWGAPSTVAIARAALARCMPPNDGVAQMVEALALLPCDKPCLARAYLLVIFGNLLLAASRPKEAREMLLEGLDAATRIAAVRLSGEAHAALKSLGARPRRPHSHGVLSLTPAERRVGTLAATGLSNKQIAARLHLSVRTVENHLRHVYGKLETDRAGLAEHLSEEQHAREAGAAPQGSLPRARDRPT